MSLTPDEKLEIASQLSNLGVDTIEAGFPITSPGEIQAVKLIAGAGLKSEICALARAEQKDIDLALGCNVDLIHIFIATSDIHLKHKLRMTRDEAFDRAVKAVQYAKDRGAQVEFSAEDATRSDPDYLIKVFQGVSDAGADRVAAKRLVVTYA